MAKDEEYGYCSFSGDTHVISFSGRRRVVHAVGTCRMGSDEASVVDTALKVRGVEALRVCDSSVMPCLISSNTNAAAMMIGEKASDLILAANSRDLHRATGAPDA